MKYLLYGALLCAVLTGCDDQKAQAQHDAQVAQQAREQLLAELKAKEEAQKAKEQNTALSKLGITKEGSASPSILTKLKPILTKLPKHSPNRWDNLPKRLKKGMRV